MSDPLGELETTAELLDLVADAAQRYLRDLDTLPPHSKGSDAAALSFDGALPEEGEGGFEPIRRLIERAPEAATRSAGPRFFHFVTGGSTPAALAADWLTSTLDNNASVWVSSPLGAQLEKLALAWLKDLFRLPPEWAGVLTTGATMANFTALAAAREWWGEQQGVNVAEQGLAGLPPTPVLTSGFVHASVLKALVMLGIGKNSVQVFAKDKEGRVDIEALEQALKQLRGQPAIVVATAGEVNAGGFDPIEDMAELAHRYQSWLHVDAAFGLFARVSPLTQGLAAGIEKADSAIADGHKWLNVPYDCGYAFVRDGSLLNSVFGLRGPYFPEKVADRPDFLLLGPEMSRRARALPVWATLAAYGRQGYRQLVERHVGLAQRLASQVKQSSEFELLEEPVLNVVCFRCRPRGVAGADLDELNRRLGQAILEDGRVVFGTTTYAGKVAFRPAISNWRTTESDIDVVLPVTRELANRLLALAKN